jgi:uncharacterized protein
VSVYPSYKVIIELHRKYAPSEAAIELVFGHCEIIWQIAAELLDRSDVAADQDFVHAACLLHDIGVYRLYMPDGQIDHANYIKHGVLGYDILKTEGIDETLCRIASCHTGVGLTAQEVVAEQLPLPVQRLRRSDH